IPVFLIAGNHDAQSVMTKSLRLPDNVHTFSTRKAETVHLEELGVALHGQGFATKSVSKDLSAKYPPPVSNAYNIGLLHTSLTGYEGHDDYAPCTVAGLTHLGYDYWALGHIHQQECIHPEEPAIWYSGCIQGRHIRETEKKGCLVVDVDEQGDHSVRFETLDVLRWTEIELDASTCADVGTCVDQFSQRLETALEEAGDRFLAVRVVITGKTEIHDQLVADGVSLQNELRNAANIHGGEQVWVEKVKVRTRPLDSGAGDAFDDGPLAMLHEVVASMKSDEAALEGLSELLKPLQDKLPSDLKTGDEALDFSDPALLTTILGEAEPTIRRAWRAMEAGQ
ncbi:MAG: DNA repair exonuclease, partial [Candidatus Hydrogenedentes bacterium]|nr:DNA repair exonuclease [Candidatus Hydrogenedentota bacterium]